MTDARFARTAEGVALRLAAVEVDLLRRIPEELRTVYESDGSPARDRLFPRAYLDPTEETSEQEWQALVGPDLLAQRLETLATVNATLERLTGAGAWREGLLVDAEADAWLAFLNDARLALGARLGITEETDLGALPAEDPDAHTSVLYGWLTWLQGELVEVLME